MNRIGRINKNREDILDEEDVENVKSLQMT